MIGADAQIQFLIPDPDLSAFIRCCAPGEVNLSSRILAGEILNGSAIQTIAAGDRALSVEG
jgi:hypothetical protein